MVAAVCERDAQRVIQFLRRRVKNLSQEALARMCGVAQSTITRAEAGKGLTDRRRAYEALQGLGAPLTPSAATDEAAEQKTSGPSLSVEPGDLFIESVPVVVRQSGRLWESDLGESLQDQSLAIPPEHLSTPLLRWLVAPPALVESHSGTRIKVTEDDVHAINRACDLFEHLDHEFGGGHARIAAVQYLSSEVAPLLKGNYSPDIGRALFSASARFAAKTGAMAYDAGLHHLGRRYFLQALNLAHFGADRLFGAKALALLSHQANFLGDFQTAVDLARTAKAGTGSVATPKVQAMLAAMEARGLASLGEERACTRALAEMEAAFTKADPDQELAWMGYFDGSEVADEFAHCFHDLGRGKSAIEHAQLSIKLAPASFRRSRTFAGLVQAGAHLTNELQALEAACDLAEQTIAAAGRLRSARVRTYIARFQKRLEPYGNSRPVQELRAALTDFALLQG